MNLRSAAEQAARNTVSVARWAHYNRWHRRDAMAAVETMARYNDRPLSSALRRECDAYARGVLGSSAHAPWLYLYAAAQQDFHEGWLPDSYFGRWVVPRLNNGVGALSAAKTLTRRTLRSSAVPDLAYVIDGLVYDLDMHIVDPATFLADLAERHSEVFVKDDGSAQGRGVRLMPLGELRRRPPASLGNCVLQEAVRQHADFDAISVGSVATVRITTVKEPGGDISVRGAFLRMGLGGSTHINHVNHLRLAVTADDGQLDPLAFDSNWRVVSQHPYTGASFGGRRIPHYAAATALCRELHATFPHFGIVGWDVTVDHAGDVVVFEWNAAHTGIKFAEATTGPWFADMGWDRLHLSTRG